MGELLNAVNFLEIQNAKTGSKAEATLRDLEGYSNYIAKKTGETPVSWYEFSQTQESQKPNYLKNIAVGAGVGAAALGAIALTGVLGPILVPALGSGAILGGLFGGYHNTENSTRAKQVNAYADYLKTFEQTHGHGKGIGLVHDGIADEFQRIGAAESRFAQQVKERKEQECGCKGR